MNARVLVMAKAPVPGLAKTRLGAGIGMEVAADLAAAALLDTLATCREAFGDDCHLALDGDLRAGRRGYEIADALATWTVFAQCGATFGERLAHAHGRLAAGSPGVVVQIGMDTPQVTSPDLRLAAGLAADGAAVLGPALDGGWWVLALDHAERAAVLSGVPMSTEGTYAATWSALAAAGLEVRDTGALVDVDTVEDAALVASAAPGTRFGRTWLGLAAVAR
ncbi:MAG: cofC 2 [Marmoricola sp.]|nr:cofC 2 [Marmoricola sp.]